MTTDISDMALCPQVETQWADSRRGLGLCCPTQPPAPETWPRWAKVRCEGKRHAGFQRLRGRHKERKRPHC